ncbi:hypothetical protein ACGFIE_13170 [Micromonospora sp. NPDC049275]
MRQASTVATATNQGVLSMAARSSALGPTAAGSAAPAIDGGSEWG